MMDGILSVGLVGIVGLLLTWLLWFIIDRTSNLPCERDWFKVDCDVDEDGICRHCGMKGWEYFIKDKKGASDGDSAS